MIQVTHGKKSLIVEGNIGAGKSTFLKIMRSYLDLDVVFEPHTRWQNIGEGENLLDMFYKDTQRWGYTFQTYAFISRVYEQEQALATSQSQSLLFERSIYSDRYCFAKNCYEMGTMTPMEWDLYCEWFQWLDRFEVTGFVYLQTDPTICYERLIKRNRSEESAVSLDYLKKLHEKHENWLVKKEGIAPRLHNVPVLVLECNVEFENNIDEQRKHAAAIAQFFGVENKYK